ncbi:hypothetical protein E5082_09630 [Streptomyces griseoluteus]|uniref:Uncharacterized protein n=1 Tax=Streptomyces griseoluteus TaxID=29306 RepID=A0A4Z1DKF9_STRGP|nr:hypothetical protein [Streptomyces griseoluteus]TGN84639.1 hypothetical protein E5082_09630 [Streptomyces griseoluteus]GHF00192.1 hypothetical protein GCM10017776_16530 [Streptomyces griseoluteus]
MATTTHHVLTTASTVTCGNGLPQGMPPPPVAPGLVTTTSTAVLKVDGHPVLRKTDITSATSVNCLAPSPAKKCTKVQAVTTGESTKLKARGSGVMLDTLTGTTDGTLPPAPTGLGAKAGQTKLRSA